MSKSWCRAAPNHLLLIKKKKYPECNDTIDLLIMKILLVYKRQTGLKKKKNNKKKIFRRKCKKTSCMQMIDIFTYLHGKCKQFFTVCVCMCVYVCVCVCMCVC
jgi:hypothetical protein